MGTVKTAGEKNINMLEGNPIQLITTFSVPLIFGNIFQQFYYITDAVIIGSFIGINALAAVNSCSWITWLLNAIARDLSNTLSIQASYSIGEQDPNRLKMIVGNAGTVTLGLSLILTAGVLFNLDGLLILFNVQSDIAQMTEDYFSIIMLGIPFVLIYNTAAALLRAAGNSQITFYAVASSTIINVILDLLFVAGFQWGVAGGALATVIAQFMQMLIVLLPFLKSSMFTTEIKFWKPNRELLKQMLGLWTPMFINSAVISAGGSFVSSQVNAIGPFFTAGISSGTKVFTLLESVVMAIQTGLSVFIGQNLGAGQAERIKRGVHQTVCSVLLLSLILNLLIQPLAPHFVKIFLSREDPALYIKTLHVAAVYTRFLTLGLLIMAPMYLYRIAIQTLGYPRYAMYAGFLQLGARVFSVTALPLVIGEYAYYIATLMAWGVTLPLVMIPYYMYMKAAVRRAAKRFT